MRGLGECKSPWPATKRRRLTCLGISTFGSKPNDLPTYLKPLMDHALTVIPASEVPSTPLFLYATAGMRLLPPKQRDDVLAEVCRFFRANYKFYLPDCNQHIQVISGEWEGIYGWVAINQLMGGFASGETLGFLDMGGASTQITFEPSEDIRKEHANDMMAVKLRTLGGRDAEYHVYTTTFLGYGMNEARRRYLGWLVERAQKQAAGLAKELGGKQAARSAEGPQAGVQLLATDRRLVRRAEPVESDSPRSSRSTAEEHIEPDADTTISPSPVQTAVSERPSPKLDAPATLGAIGPGENQTEPINRLTVLDPCLPKGATFKDREHLPSHMTSLNPTLVGTGSFSQCVLTTIPLLNKTVPCPDEPCLFNGVHIPGGAPGHRPDMHFIGISEYWYTIENVFRLGGDYSYKDFADAARTFCAQDWNTTMRAFTSGQYPHVHDIERLEFQCFKAAWLINVLHEGLGIPKEYLADEDKEDMVPLRSVNEISGLQISWTLGVMVIYASGTVPLVLESSRDRLSMAATVSMPLALMGICVFALFVLWGRNRKRYSARNSSLELLPRRNGRNGLEGASLLRSDIETGDLNGQRTGGEPPYQTPVNGGHVSIERRGSPKPIITDTVVLQAQGDPWAPKLARTTSFIGRASPRPPGSPLRKGSYRP